MIGACCLWFLLMVLVRIGLLFAVFGLFICCVYIGLPCVDVVCGLIKVCFIAYVVIVMFLPDTTFACFTIRDYGFTGLVVLLVTFVVYDLLLITHIVN